MDYGLVSVSLLMGVWVRNLCCSKLIGAITHWGQVGCFKAYLNMLLALIVDDGVKIGA